MKELDVVTLKSDFNGVPAGTQGTIVLEYDGTAFEVEFFDKDGRTLDLCQYSGHKKLNFFLPA